jgi:AcrR family transcriptional regulator
MEIKMRSETKREKKALSQELIMSIAHKQMEEKGTAGLSLRAIARELGVTAPAIYNYFPRLEDLITALITNAFTDLAEAMEYCREQNDEKPRIFQIKAMIYAYRQWAVDHPVDFQLIYGNPIPGYQAPFEVTGPLARRHDVAPDGLTSSGHDP